MYFFIYRRNFLGSADVAINALVSEGIAGQINKLNIRWVLSRFTKKTVQAAKDVSTSIEEKDKPFWSRIFDYKISAVYLKDII